ncbi:MAG: Gfo/Idh/MocA family oxidoreductase [Pirellulales bacterium]
MADRVCRWGILGTATIARKNWKSIWNSGNATLVAVASRDLSRSQHYIAECQAQVPFDPPPRAYGSYEELLGSDDIDAVYIPLPTGVRKEWVIRAAEAGKHVMCEKPCGNNAAEVAEILAACEANNVQFMDGVMFMHSKRLNAIRQVLDDGSSVGQIRRITSQFSFCAPDDWIDSNIRTSSELERFGCLGDLGWYNIRFALWAMNYQMPERVSARTLTAKGRSDSPSAVPVEFSAEMFFAGGVSSSFYCSFIGEHQQWVNVSGTEGYLYVDDFVLPFYGSEVGFEVSNAVFDLHGCEFNMEEHTRRLAVAEYSSGEPNAQETYLFRNFADSVLSGKADPKWGKITLQTQQVVDACLQSAQAGGDFIEL